MTIKYGKQKHPLYNSWYSAQREKNLCEEWKDDFWKFAEEVGERPANSRLYRPDSSKPLSIDNLQWKEVAMLNKDYESAAARQREYRLRNPDKQKGYDLTKSFGITLEQYREMQKSQGNVCAICGKPETTVDQRKQGCRELAVDHCHKTGKVRGLLCGHCNKALGKFKDNISVLESAIAYLNKHKEQ